MKKDNGKKSNQPILTMLLALMVFLPMGVFAITDDPYGTKEKITRFFYEKRYQYEVYVAHANHDGKVLDVIVKMPVISGEKYRVSDENMGLVGPKEAELYRQIKVSLNQTMGKSRIIPGMSLRLSLLGYNNERHLSLCNIKDECYGIDKNLDIVQEVEKVDEKIVPTFVDKRIDSENAEVYQD
jgi:hypothetical protein